MKKLIPSGFRSLRERGQTLWLMVLALPAFVGAMGLATDIGNLYYNDYKLQTADDAAVLAGAHCLEGTTCVAASTATTYATANGVKNTDSITGPTQGSLGGNPTLTMAISRTVPYYFARWAGVNSGTVNVSAEAEVGPAGGLNDALPLGLQACGTGLPCPAYSVGQSLSFGAKKNDGTGAWVSGSGDWSALQGAATPTNTVSTCPPPAAACISSNPGFAKIKSIIDEANALGTGAIVCVPMVDWTLGGAGCNGNCSLNVYGFAAIQLGPANPPGVDKGPNNSSISATFVNDVCNGTIASGGGGGDVGAFAEKLIQ